MKHTLIVLLMPNGYNVCNEWRTVVNQWLHVGFLKGFWTYEWYSNHQFHTYPKHYKS